MPWVALVAVGAVMIGSSAAFMTSDPHQYTPRQVAAILWTLAGGAAAIVVGLLALAGGALR